MDFRIKKINFKNPYPIETVPLKLTVYELNIAQLQEETRYIGLAVVMQQDMLYKILINF